MIIEIQPNTVLLSAPPQWWLYYKQDTELHFNKISLTYEKLKLFLETYGYETNDIIGLKNFGIDVKNMKQNSKL